MTTVLRRRVPHMVGETAISLASRLATANGVCLGRFCQHMGLRSLGVLNGDTGALAMLAGLADADPVALAAGTMVKVGNGRFVFHGQELTVPVLRRLRPWFCPLCARGDILTSDLTPNEAVYGRALWSVEQLQTCLTHRVKLLDPAPRAYLSTYDLSDQVRSAMGDLDGHCGRVEHRDPSGLELYLHRRLESGSGDVPWLDGLAFNTVCTAAQRVGAVAAVDRQVRFERLSSRQWWEAGAAGYAILSRGVVGLTDFLDELQSSFDYGTSGVEKANAVYGKLYAWLNDRDMGPEFEPLRAVVREHVLDRFPLEPGSRVFGVTVERRRLHSIRSASRETGRHPVRLRLVLDKEGLLPPDHVGKHDALVTFDADKAAPFLTRVAGTVTKAEVATLMGVVTVGRLVGAGLLTPMPRPVRKRKGQVEFLKAEVDEVMAGVLRHAVPWTGSTSGHVNLYTAAKWTRRNLGDIVRLVAAGEFGWVGIHTDKGGFDGVMLKVRDLEPWYVKAELPGLLEHEAVKALNTSDLVVRRLIESGKLPTHRMRSPRSNRLVDVIRHEDIRAFKDDYATLHTIARERKIHFQAVKKQLQEQGIEPVLPASGYGASFYLRSMLV